MEQMIPYKNNKQTNKQTKNRNRSWPRRADLGFLWGKVREWDGWAFWGLGGCKPLYLEWMGN